MLRQPIDDAVDAFVLIDISMGLGFVVVDQQGRHMSNIVDRVPQNFIAYLDIVHTHNDDPTCIDETHDRRTHLAILAVQQNRNPHAFFSIKNEIDFKCI